MSENSPDSSNNEQLDLKQIESTLDTLGLGILKPALNLFGIGALLLGTGNSNGANPILAFVEKIFPPKNTEQKEENTSLGTAPTKSPSTAPTTEHIFSQVLNRKSGSKSFASLNAQETYSLTKKVFGNGPGAHLLQVIDQAYGGRGEACKRMITLGIHEGGLKFGRENRDPASGYNFGTFQIGGWGSTREISYKKYTDCLQAGMNIYKERTGVTLAMNDLNAADKDLIAHIGYIFVQRGGEATLKQLANPSLSDQEVVQLMHKKIQGGIPAIGNAVLAMTRQNSLFIV